MWMRIWQVLLFCAGVILPFMAFPQPLPPFIDKTMLSVGLCGTGVALAWLGSVGISRLLSVAAERGRQWGSHAGAEGIAGRSETLLKK